MTSRYELTAAPCTAFMTSGHRRTLQSPPVPALPRLGRQFAWDALLLRREGFHSPGYGVIPPTQPTRAPVPGGLILPLPRRRPVNQRPGYS
jgi:hypothetical protein